MSSTGLLAASSSSPQPTTPKKHMKNKKKEHKYQQEVGGLKGCLLSCFCCRDFWSKHIILKWFFPLVVVALISFLYTVFFLNVMLPEYQYSHGNTAMFSSVASSRIKLPPPVWKATANQVVAFLVVFHILFSLLIFNFLRATFTSPGNVPALPKWREGDFSDISAEDTSKLVEIYETVGPELHNPDVQAFLRAFPLVERKFGKKDERAKNGIRECKFCHHTKPDRTHHCRICDRCVLRMDHHCPWIANCVGFHNYKFFLLLLTYAELTLICVLVGELPRIIDGLGYQRQKQFEMHTWVQDELLVFIAYVLALVMAISLGVFLSWHLKLAASALTTIEIKEKKQLYQEPEIVARHNIAHVKFDYGAYSNLKHVLGPLWTWLLPIAPASYVRDPKGDGHLLVDQRGEYVQEDFPGCYYVSPRKNKIWRSNSTTLGTPLGPKSSGSGSVMLFLTPNS